MLQAFHEMEKRFIHQDTGLPLNYTGLHGEVFLPTEDEIRQGKPSLLSWNCPIEDGAYYGGLYLSAMTNLTKYGHFPSHDAARRVADGLITLSESSTAGFIARNAIGPHRLHYAIGSNDQTFPWFYGLWCYARSNLPTASEKARIICALGNTTHALQKLQWKIPSDPLSVGFRGDYSTRAINDVAKLLFILRAMHELTGDSSWLDDYHQKLYSCPPDCSQTRLELLSNGAGFTPYDGRSVFYCLRDGEDAETVFGHPVSILSMPYFTKSMVDIAMRALHDMETDDNVRIALQKGLQKDAAASVSHITRYQGFNLETAPAFSPNWRVMNALWHEHHTAAEAHDIAWRQMAPWFRECPRFPYENSFVREPLFAGYVVALGQGPASKQSLTEQLSPLLLHYPWSRLHTSTFYVALCIYGQLLADENVNLN